MAGRGETLGWPWIPLPVRACLHSLVIIISRFPPHERMARGGHGLHKVSPGPVMPYPPTPAGRPPLKQPYGRSRGDPPARRATCGCLLPFWTPHGPTAPRPHGPTAPRPHGPTPYTYASQFPPCSKMSAALRTKDNDQDGYLTTDEVMR
jgi:hypothetical protein